MYSYCQSRAVQFAYRTFDCPILDKPIRETHVYKVKVDDYSYLEVTFMPNFFHVCVVTFIHSHTSQ